jgi:hypothetical protein
MTKLMESNSSGSTQVRPCSLERSGCNLQLRTLIYHDVVGDEP